MDPDFIQPSFPGCEDQAGERVNAAGEALLKAKADLKKAQKAVRAAQGEMMDTMQKEGVPVWRSGKMVVHLTGKNKAIFKDIDTTRH